jgi:hypothetical protein
VRYELGFLSQKTAFFIVTAVKTSNLTEEYLVWISGERIANNGSSS